MTHVIALANQKGGVGKTTSAVNIAAALGAMGHTALLIDLDPQGNATSGVGINKREATQTVYDWLLEKCDTKDAIYQTEYKNLYVVPSNISLAGAEVEIIDIDHREALLKNHTEKLRAEGNFEYIFIDCPPSLGLLTVNALTAADSVIIPMQCEYYPLEGLSQLMVTIKRVKSQYNRTLSVLGILVTMYNGRLNLSTQVMGELKRYYPDKLFRTTVCRNVKLSEAPSFGSPVYYHDKYSRGSLDYIEIAKEVIQRCEY